MGTHSCAQVHHKPYRGTKDNKLEFILLCTDYIVLFIGILFFSGGLDGGTKTVCRCALSVSALRAHLAFLHDQTGSHDPWRRGAAWFADQHPHLPAPRGAADVVHAPLPRGKTRAVASPAPCSACARSRTIRSTAASPSLRSTRSRKTRTCSNAARVRARAERRPCLGTLVS